MSDARPTAAVVIPCLDEEASIGGLVADVIAVRDNPATPVAIAEIVVVDNGSTDATARVAREAGARVVPEPRRGYGRACLTGVQATAGNEDDTKDHYRILIRRHGRAINVAFADGHAQKVPLEETYLMRWTPFWRPYALKNLPKK